MPRGQGGDKDWGNVRGSEADHGSPKGRGSPSKQTRGFATDTQISNTRHHDGGEMGGRELQRFDFGAYDGGAGADWALEGEDETWGGDDSGGWDQFKVNEQKFGVVSTFKADLSQYTTVLDKSKVTKEMRQRADKIAREVERQGTQTRDEEYYDGDEEDLFSAVIRGPGGGATAGGGGGGAGSNRRGNNNNSNNNMQSHGNNGESGAGAGKAILASLMASGGGAQQEDYRSIVRDKVQGWWRARRTAGVDVPPAADMALVCPFSERASGDVSQLITHWAACLPRAAEVAGSAATPSLIASQCFGQTSQRLLWSEMATAARLDQLLPVEGPKAGSVWEQILSRGQKTAGEDSPVSQQPVATILAEAVKLKCWRRDQKIEHREVMEALAGSLAVCLLSEAPDLSPDPWGKFAGSTPASSA
mmetsp:Transcript_21156/g.45880  ORF Transcript_21156/g.45880 Transcript_21156/m.45880 type:complete len:418 (+) Transcript_21156:248-1501(+)|eukprot:CAMPEP_0206481278 /NCGR_PEP_ID=MMETSP0324_2-20121206/38042_1 /ASSEMBLY_ACC=CAM_ASM_000836 /TAXON_ID=2866 /ORGANISM="Crypthecodinium cohnii, Strain Seligo" /LENGTH=417 /DNA_ID=CAMNT_0053958721 /DNA_START=189 /DNA_END=1442 /DNA_ORIENTATION=+